MAGLIKPEDIAEVRARTDIREVVEGYVTLKSAGIGSWKGLCPFHDERSPSFHVRPQVGTYHCFGCGESGDVISFVMKMDHTAFAETVEKLAARIGYELRYEDGAGPRREEVGRRQRLLDAHKIAAEYFQSQLLTPAAAAARQFLFDRGFERSVAEQFGVGFAPPGWDSLLKHLRGKSFRDEELKLTGMFSEGNRGLYDRFRGRLIWPIRDITGDVIGFGARRLFEDDQGPKYLNTPETALYKKSQVLYGIDMAKRNIAKKRQLVVVEGYTDVMACHLAGVDTAVASCGTAFGAEHIKIARRLLSDDGTGGEVVFTFDGDAAGQKAALRAFEEDQRFVAQTYVAVEPNGMDPCELRQHRGDEAVRSLIGTRRPLFEFAIQATLRKHNLESIEGRVAALREAAPVVAQIRDHAIRPAYTRELAKWLGVPLEDVSRAVASAGRRPAPSSGPERASHPQAPQRQGAAARDGGAPPPAAVAPPAWHPDPRDPVAVMERQALEVALQQPQMLVGAAWAEFASARFAAPAHAALHAALVAAGRPAEEESVAAWIERIRHELAEPLRPMLAELAVTPLPATTEESLERYCRDILAGLAELQITAQKAEMMGQLQRLDPSDAPEEFQRLNRGLMELELRRRALRSGE
ncbi:DNA primase [Sinomonas cellulolyticus]|uniref:DNA primase n=1 Tax=Sinomonas cellulolyticus TaxID=2801916 RepID=A0ABS1JYN6_9MICC|nr:MULTISPECIES: DNA primase [Sinomonas]MBL0704323.1 DNA primase [Sinomonas cellulolyticus]GHG47997.1 DNA primase [Sinomonas sp. KCTC 49339]